MNAATSGSRTLIVCSTVLPPCDQPTSATRPRAISRRVARYASAPSASSLRRGALIVRSPVLIVHTSRRPRALKLSGNKTA